MGRIPNGQVESSGPLAIGLKAEGRLCSLSCWQFSLCLSSAPHCKLEPSRDMDVKSIHEHWGTFSGTAAERSTTLNPIPSTLPRHPTTMTPTPPPTLVPKDIIIMKVSDLVMGTGLQIRTDPPIDCTKTGEAKVITKTTRRAKGRMTPKKAPDILMLRALPPAKNQTPKKIGTRWNEKRRSLRQITHSRSGGMSRPTPLKLWSCRVQSSLPPWSKR